MYKYFPIQEIYTFYNILHFKINFIYSFLIIIKRFNMGKRTTTIQATLKDATDQKLVQKPKKARTSTIAETVATSGQGFKKKAKPTKTRTMAETLKDAQTPTPVKSKTPKKTKRVSKKGSKSTGAKKAKKVKATKKK